VADDTGPVWLLPFPASCSVGVAQLDEKRLAWTILFTFYGLAYVLIGSIGSSIRAVVWPRVMSGYATATVTEQQIRKADFSLVNNQVDAGLWNLLAMTFAAAWWIFTGYLLRKNTFSFKGWLTILTVISSWDDAISGLLQLGWLHRPPYCRPGKRRGNGNIPACCSGSLLCCPCFSGR
jgi:hypothetical protein